MIRARILGRELLDFAAASGSRRALCFGHLALAAIYRGSGDAERTLSELRLAREAAPDPFYQTLVDLNLGGTLASSGRADEARTIVEHAVAYTDAQGASALAMFHRGNLGMVLLAEGELTRGMDMLETCRTEAHAMHSSFFDAQTAMTVGTIYARIATGEGTGSGSKLGGIMRNPSFVMGRARKASQTAYESAGRTEPTPSHPSSRDFGSWWSSSSQSCS